MTERFAMPAEWEPHRATWLAWPHNPEDWPGKFEPIPWVYAELVRFLARNEIVGLIVRDAAHETKVRAILAKVGVARSRVKFLRLPTDRSWLRDSGPIFVKRGSKRRATCWRFNAWAKYSNWKRDIHVAPAIAKASKVPAEKIDLVLEGGAIDVDGKGTLLATEECLLDRVQERNPGLGREGTERALANHLGIDRVVWLGKGIVGDDTHGHVDDVARFVAPGRVLLCEERNPKDPNHRILAENRERLAGLDVIPLPMPSPVVFEGQRVPASYANFYIANGLVLVPTFNDAKDRLALGLIAELFPDREVVGIHCGDFIWGLGTIHCATQQEPA